MTLEEAKEIIFAKKIIFGQLYQKYQDKFWNEYFNSTISEVAPLEDPQNEIVKIITEHTRKLLGEENAELVEQTLSRNPFVSTADHHGILCHPFFSNASLMRSNSNNLKNIKAIISLTCGGISLSNSSYPRGIFFHDENLKIQKISLISLKYRRRSIYGLHSMLEDNLDHAITKIDKIKLPEVQKKRLLDLLLEFKKVKPLERCSDEITVLNNILWQKIFDDTRPPLVYIETESIIRELILSNLQNENIVSKIIFDEKYRDAYIKNYENIIGAHNTDAKTGSHLFWYIDNKDNVRKQLFVKNGSLVSLDEKILIPLTIKDIGYYLQRFELLPTMALCYSILSFHYGLTLGGGFSQIQYLGEMKNAYQKTINETGTPIIYPDVKTDIFSGEFVQINIADNANIEPASLIDLYLWSHNPNQVTEDAEKNTSIGESLDQMMQEYVTIMTGTKEKISDLKKPLANININEEK